MERRLGYDRRNAMGTGSAEPVCLANLGGDLCAAVDVFDDDDDNFS